MILSILTRAIFAFFAVLAYTQMSHAQDYQLGNAMISGSGCPAGSAAVVVSPDKKTISVLFDKFTITKLANSQGPAIANCQLMIQVRNITPGYVLDTTTFDLRGFAQLPQGVTAILGTRGGAEGAGRDNRIVEQISSSGDFSITRVAQQSNINRCHSRPNDMIRLGITLRINRLQQSNEDSILALDSADMGNDSGMKVGVALKQCDEKNGKVKDIFERVFGDNGNGRGNGFGRFR